MIVEVPRRVGYYGILLFGLVSLLADIVYEGGRSVVPEFLRDLGASAAAVGLVTGLGELVGYALRFPSGFLADQSGKYWFFLILGYSFILFIPTLAFAGGWELAALLVFAERFGKAVRAPSRDTAISIVARNVGTGRAFGLHELLDQVGAVLGPLLVSAAIAFSMNNVRFSFSVLIVPALATLLVLYIAYVKLRGYVSAGSLPRKVPLSLRGLNKRFWTYNLVAALSVVGFLHYSLIAYRVGGLVEPWIIPLLFAAAMGIDALTAVTLGFAYDHFKMKVFWIIILASALPAIFAVKCDAVLLSIAILTYGIGMGAQESIYRSVVADLSPLEMRATAYGVFNTIYGLAWLVGGFTMGLMYDLGAAVGPWLVASFCITCQLTAAISLTLLLRTSRSG
ncbi:MAG: MFS transporter [Candidatus Freyarchaeota archaeon]|nr:MFS transporter [Candidatus Jordarchaeia archaeon]